jgi:hypothetical protein
LTTVSSGILTEVARNAETDVYFERIRSEGLHKADPHALVDMVLDRDLDRSLFGIGLLEGWLVDQEMVGVFRARKQRKSWAWIGARLGRSRQAVWERWRDKSDEDPET